MDLFKDIIHSILVTKKNVMHTQADVKEYKPFIVNRALSYHVDCILYVNKMNRYNLDPDMQYQYLLHSVRGMRRQFRPWMKPEKVEDLELIKTVFGYSNKKAQDALRILTPVQIEEIRKSQETGGVKR